MIITVGLLLAAHATAPSQSPTSEPDKVQCRSILEAGSRIPFRVCRTKAEWDRIAKEAQTDLQNSRNSRTAGCKGTLGC